jgi:hypothetical protein
MPTETYRSANQPVAANHMTPAYALLPAATITASPVPGLTSLYHFDQADEFGDRRYPGNCGGRLIHDLLCYFRPANVLDPMTGSGTCREVCRTLKIPCRSADLKSGFDACDPSNYPAGRQFDFVWLHPPYWRQKRYSDSPLDLSTATTLDEFLRRYRTLIGNCAGALSAGGKLAILIGDYTDREAGFVPLTYHTKQIAFDTGLRQHCTDIVRFVHGATSSRKTYRSSFIPNLHDVCLIFTRRQ